MKYSIFILFLCCSVVKGYSQANCGKELIIFGSTPVCDYNPWVIVFEDDFDGTTLDETKWDLPYQGVIRDYSFSSSKQWNANTGTTPSLPIDNNIQVSNGTLKLTAKKEIPAISGTYVTDWATNPPTTQTSSFDYSSGELWTKEKFGFGKYEIRCKLPKGKGFFPAFWTYGDPYKNEIDVFEFWNENDCFGSYDASRLSKNPHFNFHNDDEQDGTSESCPEDVYGPCSSWNGPDYSADFHTFTMVWNFYTIEWYIDGSLARKVTRFLDASTGTLSYDCDQIINGNVYQWRKAFPANYTHNIIVDLAIQSGGGAPDVNTPLPSSMEIDYIRYYKRAPCVSNVTYTATSQLNLSATNFNVLLGKTITAQTNVVVASDKQLKFQAQKAVVLKPGFQAAAGSVFQAVVDPSMCYTAMPTNDPAPEQFEHDYDITELADGTLSGQELSDEAVRVYPNPTKGIVNIELNDMRFDNCLLTMYDLSGRSLMTQKCKQYMELDLSGFNAGVYFIEVLNANNERVYATKVVKEL